MRSPLPEHSAADAGDSGQVGAPPLYDVAAKEAHDRLASSGTDVGPDALPFNDVLTLQDNSDKPITLALCS